MKCRHAVAGVSGDRLREEHKIRITKNDLRDDKRIRWTPGSKATFRCNAPLFVELVPRQKSEELGLIKIGIVGTFTVVVVSFAACKRIIDLSV